MDVPVKSELLTINNNLSPISLEPVKYVFAIICVVDVILSTFANVSNSHTPPGTILLPG